MKTLNKFVFFKETKEKGEIYNSIINTIMAGMYISIGAIIYLLITNRIVAACFFAVGIFLVTNYHSMLITRIVPMYFAKLDYKMEHIFLSVIGNSIGSIIVAFLISYSRVADAMEENLKHIVETKLQDNLLSLLIMAMFCGILVAYSSLTAKKYEKGSFAQIFYTWLFITAFVFCGFDHVVANVFYLTLYSLKFGFVSQMIPGLLVVLVGNIIGGLFVGVVERRSFK